MTQRYNTATILSVILMLGLFTGVRAGATNADLRVKNALDEYGYQYEIDSDSDYKMVFETQDDRTQLVFINSGTEIYGDLEIREVWSPIYKYEGELPAKTANMLLEASYQKKIGSFDIWTRSDGFKVVRFCAKISAAAAPADLIDVIKAVYTSADLMETQLTGTKDEY
jgi:hypothetical protein